MSTAAELIERTCNATATPEERDALTAILARDATARRAFIEHMDLHAALQWACSSAEVETIDDAVEALPESPRPIARIGTANAGRHAFWVAPAAAAIAAALLVACSLAVYFLVFAATDPEPRDPESRPPVATLIAATGTVIVGDDIANPGDAYAAGLYSIEAGSAEFMLTNSVGVRLEGNTRLRMRGNMSASLASGTASFKCPPGIVGYTVELPDGTRVVDLGTEFSIDLTDADRPRIHVADGSVRIERDGASHTLVEHDAVVIRGERVEPEPFNIWRFPETAIERNTPIDTPTVDRWRTLAGEPTTGDDQIVIDASGAQSQAMLDLDVADGSPLDRLGLIEDALVGADEQTLYLSWTTRGSGRVSNGFAGLSFFGGSDDTRLGELLFIGKAGGYTAFSTSIAPGQPADIDADPTTPEMDLHRTDDLEHRFVVRIDFRDGPDRVAIWFDPAPLIDSDDPDSEPLPNEIIDTVDLRFDRLRLASGGGAGVWTFGELTLGPTWPSVVPDEIQQPLTIEKSAPEGADENTAPIPQESLQ